MSRIKLIACEQQPIATEGLVRVFEKSTEVEYLGSAPDAAQALELVREHRPDVILVDQSLGLKVAFQFLSDSRSTWAACQSILWVSDLAEVDCFRALQLGARGILKKTLPIDALVACVKSVHEGNVWIESVMTEEDASADRRNGPRLTPRERDIVHHVCAGLKNREIAQALSITAGTVKVHLMHIFEKTGVKDRFELAVQGRKFLGIEHSRDFNRVIDPVLSK